MPDPIPHSLRKSIAVYEAGKALIAYITPEYDEIARVSICPYNMITGATQHLAVTQDAVNHINLCQLR
jgi:cell division protease FtsH